MSATPASSYRDSPPGDEDENSNASDDHQSTALDPPEEGDYYDSDSSSYGSPPRNYEMGDIRYSSPDKGSRAVSPPASIWGRKYSDNHSESLREVPLPMGGPYAPTFDVEDQMHRELHDIPLRRRSSPICKYLIGAAIFSLLVVGSVVVKNKHRTIAPLPSFDEQLNAQNPVIEGVPTSVESVAATEVSKGKNEQSSSSSEQDVATASTAEQSTPKEEETNEGSAGESTSSSGEQDVQVDVAATATAEQSTATKEESNEGSAGESNSSGSEQDVQVDVATAATATAAVEQSTPKEEETNEGSAGEISSTNGDIVTSPNTEVDDAGPDNDAVEITATTKPTPYVPKNEAGDIDIGQWCGACSSGIPGVHCDERVEYVGKKYNTPELDAKISLMENGKCHIATAAEAAAQRHTYPCRKTPEDQGGKEGAEKFCGYCRWQNSDFDCFTRVTFLMSVYDTTELEAMRGLMEGNHCVLPDNYMEQFNKEKQDGTEEWCGYCKWDAHTCETKLNMYTSSGEKTEVTVKTEILADGHCKKQPFCDANSS
jgi:hypothetical protein